MSWFRSLPHFAHSRASGNSADSWGREVSVIRQLFSVALLVKGSDVMKIDGACACGAIQIEGEADPEKTRLCHCTDCQTATGTAFRVSIPVSGVTFKMTGQPAIYVKTTADSGRPRAQAFCPKCGTPIYSTTPGEGVQPSYMLRVGILRQRDQFVPRRQNWYRSARPWVTEIGAIPTSEKQG